MSKVEFENVETVNYRSYERPVSAMAKFLVRKGVVKDYLSAERILIASIIFFILLSIGLLYLPTYIHNKQADAYPLKFSKSTVGIKQPGFIK